MEELKVTIKNAKEKIILKRANEELLDKLKPFHSEIEKYKKYDAEKNTSTESVDEEQKNHTERLVDSIKYLGRLSKNRLMIE